MLRGGSCSWLWLESSSPRQDVDAPKEEPKPKRQRRNRWGQDLSAASKFVVCVLEKNMKKNSRTLLSMSCIFFVFVGFATKTPPFVFPSDDLEGT